MSQILPRTSAQAAHPTQTRMIPGPRGLPLIGRWSGLLRLLRNPIPTLSEFQQRYGAVSSIRQMREGKRGAVLAFSPEINQQVYSDPATFYNPSLFGKKDSALVRLMSGLVSMNGEQHKSQRRLMMPAFHRSAVEGYRDQMVELTQTMLDRWSAEGLAHQSNKPRDINLEMRLLTMQVVGKALFGLEGIPESQRISRMVQQFVTNAASPAATLLPHRNLALRRLAVELEGELLKMIAIKRQSPGNDVLSTLIHAHDEEGGTLTDRELIGHTMILFLAGHETTTAALTWTLFLLSQHPHIAADVLNELDSTLGGTAPTAAQTRELPILERVIKESMRLFPPATFTLKFAQTPITLGGYQLAAKSVVFLSPYIMHRLPELYPEPDRFNPARWETITPSAYEYLPFGAGPRMCIGATFAMMEIKIVLAMVVQRYRLAMPAGAVVDYGTTAELIAPKGGLPMLIYPQDRQFTATPVSGSVRDLVQLPESPTAN